MENKEEYQQLTLDAVEEFLKDITLNNKVKMSLPYTIPDESLSDLELEEWLRGILMDQLDGQHSILGLRYEGGGCFSIGNADKSDSQGRRYVCRTGIQGAKEYLRSFDKCMKEEFARMFGESKIKKK